MRKRYLNLFLNNEFIRITLKKNLKFTFIYIENKLYHTNIISTFDRVASLVDVKEVLDMIRLDTDSETNYFVILKSKIWSHSPDKIRNKR